MTFLSVTDNNAELKNTSFGVQKRTRQSSSLAAMLGFALFLSLTTIAFAGGAGYISLLAEVTLGSGECGTGKSKFRVSTREYNSEVLAPVGVVTVKDIVNQRTVSGTSAQWEGGLYICFDSTTEGIDFTVVDGANIYRAFSGNYKIEETSLLTGRNIVAHIHLLRDDGSGSNFSVRHGTDPVNGRWYNTEPEFDIIVEDLPSPSIHNGTAVDGIRLFTGGSGQVQENILHNYVLSSQSQSAPAGYGAGNYSITLSPGTLTEGPKTWGFFAGLNGRNKPGSPEPIAAFSGTARQFGIDRTQPNWVSVQRDISNVSQSDYVTLTGYASDGLSGISWIELYLDDNPTPIKRCTFADGLEQGPTSQQQCVSDPQGSFAYGSTHTYEARAGDKAGNVRSSTSDFTVSCTKDDKVVGGNLSYPNQFAGCYYSGTGYPRRNDAPFGTSLNSPVLLEEIAIDYNWGVTPPSPSLFTNGTYGSSDSYFTTSWIGTFNFPGGLFKFYIEMDQNNRSYVEMYNPASGSWEGLFNSNFTYGTQASPTFYFDAPVARTIKVTVNHYRYATNKRTLFGWEQNADCDERAVGLNRFIGCGYSGTNPYYKDNRLMNALPSGPPMSETAEVDGPVPKAATALHMQWGFAEPAPGVGADNFFTRYKARFNMPEAGTYVFLVGHDNGAKTYFGKNGSGFNANGDLIDPELMLDEWASPDNTENDPSGLAFDPTGTKMYMLGEGTDTIYQYTLATPWDVGSAQQDIAAANVAAKEGNARALHFSPDGSKVFIVGAAQKTVYRYDLATPWDINTLFFDPAPNIIKNVGDKFTSPTGLFFSPDGLMMFVVGTHSQLWPSAFVWRYALTVPWDVRTATAVENKTLNSQDSNPGEIFFGDEGRKMYVAGYGSGVVYRYLLSEAWNLSTANYDASRRVADLEPNPTALYFTPSGEKMFVVGTAKDTVFQYSLNPAWSFSSASVDANIKNISGQDVTPEDVFMGNDGNFMYVLGSATKAVYQYILGTPWLVNTALFAADRLNVAPQTTSPTDPFFSPDGMKMYVASNAYNAGAVFQYSLTAPWDVSTATFEKSLSLGSGYGPTDVYFGDNGTKMYVTTQYAYVWQYALSVAWDIGSASVSTPKSKSMWNQDYIPTDVYLSPDGTKMFVVGSNSDTVYRYSLATAWNIDTASLDDNALNVNAKVSSPGEVYFSSDGRKMYVLGNGKVVQYTLGVAWDHLSAVDDGIELTLSTQDTSAHDIFFSGDGRKLFMLGGNSDTVHRYSLTEAWNIGTATYDNETTSKMFAEEQYPADTYFSADGRKMYVPSMYSGSIHQYSLLTPWVVSSATYDNVLLNVSAQDGNVRDLYFGADGTKLFVVGASSDTVHRYSLTEAWNIGTATYDNEGISKAVSGSEDVVFSTDGLYMYTVSSSHVYRYTLGTPWLVSSATAAPLSKYVYPNPSSARDVSFSPDGGKMYVLGVSSSVGKLAQYSLPTKWDISTALLELTKDVGVDVGETNPNGIAFSDTGNTLFVVGYTRDTVYAYTLGTAWDITSLGATVASSQSVSADPYPLNVGFSGDGLRLYISGYYGIYQYQLNAPFTIAGATPVSNKQAPANWVAGTALKGDGSAMYVNVNGNVYQYVLSTNWDIATAVYNPAAKDVAIDSGETDPTGLAFNSLGTQMYVVGTTKDTVYKYDLPVAWDLHNATRDTSASRSVLAQTTNPSDLYFGNSGSRMYLAGNGQVYQYALPAWDVSSATYVSPAKSVSGQVQYLHGISFNPSGSKMYAGGYRNLGAPTYANEGSVHEYALSSNWDIATAVYNPAAKDVAIDSGETDPTGLAFNSLGTQMYVVGTTKDTVYKYDLPVAWDLHNATRDTSASRSVSSWTSYPSELSFGGNGLWMYIVNWDNIYRFNLASAWDISSANYVSPAKSVSAQTSNPTGLFFSSDGGRMWIAGQSSDTGVGKVFGCTLATPWSLQALECNTLDKNVSAEENDPQSIAFEPDGRTMYVLGTQNDRIYRYSLSSPWNIGSASYGGTSLSVSAQDGFHTGMHFGDNGTKLFLSGDGYDYVYKYTLSPWDITTAVHAAPMKSVLAQDTNPTGVAFNTTGTRMYIVGKSTDAVHQYTLSTPWRVSSASYDTSLPLTDTGETDPEDLTFSSDGTYLFLVGTKYDSIYRYSLPTPWDISGATYDPTAKFSIGLQGWDPSDVFFKNDGRQMYVVENNSYTWSDNNIVHQFELTRAWDPVSAVYKSESKNFSTEDRDPRGIFMKSDGSKLYMAGNDYDTVRQYSLTPAWALSSATYDSVSRVLSDKGYDVFLADLPAGWLSVEQLHYDYSRNASLIFAWVAKGGSAQYCDPSLIGINRFFGCIYNGTSFTNRVKVPDEDVSAITGPDVSDADSALVTENATAFFEDWGDGSPEPVKVGVDNWSIEMTGIFTFPAGTYDFSGSAQTSMRVFFDGVQVLDITQSTPVSQRTIRRSFTDSGGTPVVIKIQYVNTTGPANIKFNWTRAPVGISVVKSNPTSNPYGMFPGDEGPVALADATTTWPFPSLSSTPITRSIPLMESVNRMSIVEDPTNDWGHYFCGSGTWTMYVDLYDPITATWNTVWSSADIPVYNWFRFSQKDFAQFPIQDVSSIRIRRTSVGSNYLCGTDSGNLIFGFTKASTLSGYQVTVNSQSGFEGWVTADSALPSGTPTETSPIVKTWTTPRSCFVYAFGSCVINGLSVKTLRTNTPSDFLDYPVTFSVEADDTPGISSTESVTLRTWGFRDYEVTPASFPLPQVVPNSSIRYDIALRSLNSYNGNVTMDISILPEEPTLSYPRSLAIAPTTVPTTSIVKRFLAQLALLINPNPNSNTTTSFTVSTTNTTPEGQYTVTMRMRGRSPEGGVLERVVTRRFVVSINPIMQAGASDPDFTTNNLQSSGRLVNGATLRFSGEVTNAATNVSSDESYARFCVDPVDANDCMVNSTGTLGDIYVPELDPLISQSVSDTWTATLGDHVVYLCADARRFVDETDETNNCSMLAQFTVVDMPPAIRVSPLQLDYITVVGESMDKRVTVTNVGGGTLTGQLNFNVGHFTCSPANPGGVCTFSLAPDESVDLLIRYTPTAIGVTPTDSARATSNGAEPCTLGESVGTCVIILNGEGTNVLTFSGLNFGNVIVNRTKEMTLTLRNNSTSVNIGSGMLNFGGPFSCVSSSGGGVGVCSYNLPPGATNTFVIQFRPTTLTAYSEPATLSNVPPPGYPIQFTGTGVSGVIKFQDQ